jgi:hypothetical protein
LAHDYLAGKTSNTSLQKKAFHWPEHDHALPDKTGQ